MRSCRQRRRQPVAQKEGLILPTAKDSAALWLVQSTTKLLCFSAEALETFRVLQESGKPVCKRPCDWEDSSILSHRRSLEQSDGDFSQKGHSVTFTGHDRLFLQLQTLTNNPRQSVSFVISSNYLCGRCWGHSSEQTDPILVLVENIVAWRIWTKSKLTKNKIKSNLAVF